MLREIFWMELKLVFSKSTVYILFFIPVIYITGSMLNSSFILAGMSGGVYRNAPHVIATYSGVISLFGIIVGVLFFNKAALRDYDHNFSDIFFSLPISKNNYFIGRFTSALFVSTIPFLGIYIGFALGTFIGLQTGILNHSQLKLLSISSFIMNYLIIILPNMLITGTLTFIIATKWKNSVISFIAPLAIIGCYILSGTLMSDIFTQKIAAMIDMLGIRAYYIDTSYLSPSDKNTLLLQTSHLLILNRCLWVTISFILLMLSLSKLSISRRLRKNTPISTEVNNDIINTPAIVPGHPLNFNNIIQLFSFFRIELTGIIKHPVFIIMLLMTIILFIADLMTKTEYLGLSVLPTTGMMIKRIGDVKEIFIYVIIIFFGGELVWWNRQTRIAELIDATPHVIIYSLLSKVLTLSVISCFFIIILSLTSIVYQLTNGINNPELNLYIKDFFVISLPTILNWSLLSVGIQRLGNSKYLSYTLMIFIVFILHLILYACNINTHLMTPVRGTTLSYSDMNGYGSGLLSAFLFNIYWMLFASLLLLFTALKAFSNRLISASIGILWVILGVVIYDHTRLPDPNSKSYENRKIKAAYETSYAKYKNKVFPSLSEISYFVDIYTEKKAVNTLSKLVLINKSNENINEVHFSTRRGWKTTITVSGGNLVKADTRLGYCIYKLKNALKPGYKLHVTIKADSKTELILNEVEDTNIAGNGTFITSMDFLPSLGYDQDNELKSYTERKKMKLPQLTGMHKLAELQSTLPGKELITKKYEWVKMDAVVSTSNDQDAIAPGSLLKSWKINGRNYFHYKAQQPVPDLCAFVSAKYIKIQRTWRNKSLEIFYDKKHAFNVDKMMNAIEKSLNYCTKNFGPYDLTGFKIAEFPGYENYAQSFPGMVAYSESMGFLTDLRDRDKFNVVQMVIAHEVSHQWWGYQVIPGHVQGEKMLDESLAEYSSLMVMKNEFKNKAKMSSYMEYIADIYKRTKSRNGGIEPALYKVEENRNVYYAKANLIFYALQDYIGEKAVNTALRNYLTEFRFKDKQPTSLDLLRHINKEVPDSLKEMINDWFKKVVVYNLKLKAIQLKKINHKSFKVTIASAATKIETDSLGKPHVLPFHGWADLAVYSDKNATKLLFNKKVKIDNGTSIDLFFPSKPALIVVDPYHILLSSGTANNKYIIR